MAANHNTLLIQENFKNSISYDREGPNQVLFGHEVYGYSERYLYHTNSFYWKRIMYRFNVKR